MHRGYIRLWRKIEDNPLSKDPYFMALWSWILLLSNHQEKEWKIGYQKIPVKTGQFATSRASLSKKTGIHESKIERILKYLESEQQIEQQKTTKYRLITVLKWSNYQNIEQQSEQQVNNKRTASEQQVNTTKECIRMYKNDKNKIARSPKVDSPMLLNEFIEWTQTSKQRHINLIGTYADAKKPEFTTKDQWSSFIKRNLRPAQRLSPFTDEQIKKAAEELYGAEWLSKWTLETLEKFLIP